MYESDAKLRRKSAQCKNSLEIFMKLFGQKAVFVTDRG